METRARQAGARHDRTPDWNLSPRTVEEGGVGPLRPARRFPHRLAPRSRKAPRSSPVERSAPGCRAEQDQGGPRFRTSGCARSPVVRSSCEPKRPTSATRTPAWCWASRQRPQPAVPTHPPLLAAPSPTRTIWRSSRRWRHRRGGGRRLGGAARRSATASALPARRSAGSVITVCGGGRTSARGSDATWRRISCRWPIFATALRCTRIRTSVAWRSSW